MESLRRRQLGKEDGGAHSQRHRDQQRQEGRQHRSVDEGQRAELFGYRVPGFARQEAESELGARGAGVDPELIHQEHGDQKYAGGKEERDEVGDLIAVAPKCDKFARTRLQVARWLRQLPFRTSYFIKAICFCSLATTGFGSGA